VHVDGLGGDLSASGAAIQGGIWSLNLDSCDGLLLVGVDLGPPVSLGSHGLLFMNPATMLVVPVPGLGPMQLDLPVNVNTDSLGMSVACQTYSTCHGLSRPVFASILTP
jgi:hypothetical protein